MNPSFKDQLKEWKKQHQDSTPKIKKRHKKPKKRKSELLTESDIKSLMGMNKAVMKRGRGGAWRNGR
jgi:hypothetical protein